MSTKEEQSEFTQDLRILPDPKYIEELLDADAEAVADELKGKLLAIIEHDRGDAKVPYAIKDRLEARVVKKMRVWAELYGYTFRHTASWAYLSVMAKKTKKPKVCSACDHTNAKFRWGFWVVSSGLILAAIVTALFYWHAVAGGCASLLFVILGGVATDVHPGDYK